VLHGYSALVDRTDQVVGMFPTAPVDNTVSPFMNQTDVLPLLVSRQRRSLLPSPL
jgi:hypothetical protein